MSESLIIQSKVREEVRKNKPEFRLSEEFLTELSASVERTINGAIKRCEANGRKTLNAQDI